MDLATRDLRKRIIKFASIFIIIITVLSFAILTALVNNGVSLFAISGKSMEPTFHDKDSVIIQQEDKIADNQIIFFNKPDSWKTYAVDKKTTLVKRIVAVPGDTLSYDGSSFLVNGKSVYDLSTDSYECKAGEANYSHMLSKSEIFVMGDNPNHSLDSRRIFCDGQTQDSFIPKNNVINYGKVVLKF